MAILNYTTQVDANKTAQEVIGILAKAGATRVGMMFDGGRPAGVEFTVKTAYGPRDFQLPVNFEGVYRALNRDAEPRYRTRDQAYRVAWRITKDWIEAQMALVDAGIASMDQTMLPYMISESGRTVYAVYADSQLAIEGATA